MGVAKLKKAELFYHKSVREEIAGVIQETGVCQIIGNPERDVKPADIESRLTESEERLSEVRYLLRALTPHYDDPVSSVDRMLGERPVVSMDNLSKLARDTDLGAVAAKVREVEHEVNELKLESSQLRANRDLIASLTFFPYALSAITEGTRTVRAVAGVIKVEQLNAFKEALNGFSRDTELILAPQDAKTQEIRAVLLLSRSREAEILEVCVKSGLSLMDLPASLTGIPGEEMDKNADAMAKLEERERALTAGLRRTAQEWMPRIQALSDYWNSLAGRYSALCSGSDETVCTLRTCFWVPAADAACVQKKIEAISPNVALFLSDPVEGDEPPTLLENGQCIRPFNVLTTLYSPPVYRGIDPTPLLAPFFFVFFGMCLGDAGYALVMLGAIYWLFKKYRRIPLGVKDFLMLFAFCSVSTFVYGIISGSFFGDFIDAFLPSLSPVKNMLMLVDPMSDPIQVLGISLLLGVIHLMFGLLVAAYDNFRMGQPVDAVGANISWCLLVVGLCLLGTAAGGLVPPYFDTLGRLMAVGGAVIIFWYAGRDEKNIAKKFLSGCLALYGATSYLGDILSYSRLLALGFGSAIIGMVINLLGNMSADIPYVGWLIAVIVVVGGHFFSILINLLGAFVHPLRLQYVEFFGKCYTGGGEPFIPLTRSGEFVEIG